MDKQIELVKKWLANKDSVSLEELEANSQAAARADATDVYDAAARSVANAATAAAEYAAVYDNAYCASYWVNRYEELIDAH
jgi:hypothetical protein